MRDKLGAEMKRTTVIPTVARTNSHRRVNNRHSSRRSTVVLKGSQSPISALESWTGSVLLGIEVGYLYTHTRRAAVAAWRAPAPLHGIAGARGAERLAVWIGCRGQSCCLVV